MYRLYNWVEEQRLKKNLRLPNRSKSFKNQCEPPIKYHLWHNHFSIPKLCWNVLKENPQEITTEFSWNWENESEFNSNKIFSNSRPQKNLKIVSIKKTITANHRSNTISAITTFLIPKLFWNVLKVSPQKITTEFFFEIEKMTQKSISMFCNSNESPKTAAFKNFENLNTPERNWRYWLHLIPKI